MCGRVAVLAGEPVFAVVRTRLGYRLGLAALIASNLLNVITCAAEIGGLAILLHLLTGWPERILLVGSAVPLQLSVHRAQLRFVGASDARVRCFRRFACIWTCDSWRPA
jgi:manganese transport protein